MPLVDYRCPECGEASERLIRGRDIPASVPCAHCGSQETVRLVSLFQARISRKPKYSEEFVERTLPFLKSQPDLAQVFEEGKESQEAKATKISEAIGERIDQVLQSNFPRK